MLQYICELAMRWLERERREEVRDQMIKPAKVAVVQAGSSKLEPSCSYCVYPWQG